jgi:hypothetical protein
MRVSSIVLESDAGSCGYGWRRYEAVGSVDQLCKAGMMIASLYYQSMKGADYVRAFVVIYGSMSLRVLECNQLQSVRVPLLTSTFTQLAFISKILPLFHFYTTNIL